MKFQDATVQATAKHIAELTLAGATQEARRSFEAHTMAASGMDERSTQLFSDMVATWMIRLSK